MTPENIVLLTFALCLGVPVLVVCIGAWMEMRK